MCIRDSINAEYMGDHPLRQSHPSVWWTKNLISTILQEKKDVRLILDLHGHSKKMNSFFYGNPNEEMPHIPKSFPLAAAQLNQDISFRSSSFKLIPEKSSTMRQALFEEFYHNYVYTFEASFYGSLRQNEKRHFTPTDYKNLGMSICKALYKELQKEIKIEEIKSQNLNTANVKGASDSDPINNNGNLNGENNGSNKANFSKVQLCLLYTSPSPRDQA
eukprot:TRINITY_DN1968_c0_g1_i3.p1 TRINITY_DN1968_c0_g1~~TRINITY_DN1968_c0_g1_i3.p1  ORF type:complete len:218 (-),score=41.05 TRINITY_DN1968_c0_g1_i3:113-766(-)